LGVTRESEVERRWKPGIDACQDEMIAVINVSKVGVDESDDDDGYVGLESLKRDHVDINR
jgi:hypothetical protein